MYNLTNITSANDYQTIIYSVNQMSNYLLWGMVLLMLFFMYIIVNYKKDFKSVFVVGTFLLTIASIYSYVAKFIGYEILISSIILFLASLIIYKFVD